MGEAHLMGTHREIAFRVDQGKGVLSPIETVLGSEHLGCDYYSRVCLQGTKLGKDMLVGWEEGVVPKYYAVRKTDWHSRFESTHSTIMGAGR
jgi:hypothetical protein